MSISGKDSNVTLAQWKAFFDEEEAKDGKENENKSKSSEELTDDDIKELQKELTKILSPAQTERVVKIFSGFRKNATSTETNTAVVKLENNCVNIL